MIARVRQSRGDVPQIRGVQSVLVARITAGPLDSPMIEQETETTDELDLPWQVVVHNDPVNLMSYVTMVFQKVFGFTRERAEKHMLEVHHQGRSVVWSGVRERAELYVQQLHGYLLLATIERVR
jgi:ATP-dependent Clp protease adaptor protein ClpS